MSSTARPASRKASGVARPTRPALPCGLMLAAMLGAIRATEMPTACQTDRLRRRPVAGSRMGTAMGTSRRAAGRPGGDDAGAPAEFDPEPRVVSSTDQPRHPRLVGLIWTGVAMTQQLTDDDRRDRGERARELVAVLAERDVVAVATSFVDNSGISRVKSVPLDRLPQLAAWGAGFSTAFDYFRFDDWVAAPASGLGPVGDQRIVPDLSRLVALAAQPGGAWAPGERFDQNGAAYAHDSRLLLRRQVAALAERGLDVKTAFEIEWVISAGDGDAFTPAVGGSAYGLARLGDAADYSRDVLTALGDQGVTVEQYHPEYAPGQFELSVAGESPVDAADTSVLVRATIRAVGARHCYRTSFSPKVDVSGVGNGGHVHLSIWRDGVNLMAGGDGRCGLTGDGEA